VGVATCTDADDAPALIKRTDDKLYEAKGAGRNCVRT
jgi:PleD family two-component response regulator